jgi:hypothetical protein
MKIKIILIVLLLWLGNIIWAQHISEFNELTATGQDTNFHIPSTHTFQYIIQDGDDLTEGGILPDVTDFTGYVPRESSSKYGYLSINSEAVPGGVTILDIELNEISGEWIINNSEAIEFKFGLPLANTAANCSGTVTPWNTIITCEEVTNKDIKDKYPVIPNSTLKVDGDINGYDGYGWAIEIDPKTKEVIDQPGGRNGSDKLWAMGNFKHENAVVHENKKTVYQGADDTKGEGFLFKFVADTEENLSSGDLYVYKGSKPGNGDWIKLNNSTQAEQNSTLAQCNAIGATNFGGIEDVEINPIDGLIYFAVKREDIGGGIKKGVVYRFRDSNPLDGTGVENLEIYVGGDISYDGVAWGDGTDNLVFDDQGNLWVAQDESGGSGRNYIWVVENGHTQQNHKVKIFARTPLGSEPTGLTFSPDYKYLFMSIQHPDASNDATSQTDALGKAVKFDKDVAIVIARNEYLGQDLTSINDDILISQYYHDEASNSKWVEVKNRSNSTISAGSYFLARYDNVNSVDPLDFESIPEMGPGDVLLFKNTGASLPTAGNLGSALQIVTTVCDFESDDLILISSTPGEICYDNRRDILGDDPIQNWGSNRSLIRGRGLEDPEKTFDINNWIEISSPSDVDIAGTNTNIALGTQDIGSSVWNGSWNNTTIPDKTRNVEISNTYNASNGNIEGFNLIVNSGNSLNFDSGTKNSVIIDGDLTVDGTFVIGDQESLVMTNPNANISGSITKLENSTSRDNTRDFTYWSSPVSNENIETVFTGVNPSRIFEFNASLQGSNPAPWELATGLMIPARGYAAEGRTGTTGIHSLSFTGLPNNGLIEFDIVEIDDSDLENDYNLIGNPYPSAIDIKLFLKTNETKIDQAIYLWTHATSINSQSGDYVSTDYATYNFMGGTGVNGGDPPTKNIGSGQGFFIRALNSETIVFNNLMRLADENDQFFKLDNSKSKSIEDEKDRIWLNLKTDQGGFNQVLIGFSDKATESIDIGYDALKLEGGNPISFYSVIDNSKFVIQGLSTFSTDKIINLGFDTDIAPRKFTIGIDQLEGALLDSEIYLLDKELNLMHDLKKSDYQFDQIISGDFPDRFSLQFVETALSVDDLLEENNFIISNTTNGFNIHASKIISNVKVYDLLGRLLIIIESTLNNTVILNRKTIKY